MKKSWILLGIALVLGIAAGIWIWWSQSQIGHFVEFEGPPPLDTTWLESLPKSDEGLPILSEIAGSRLVADLSIRDPITALASCTSWITSCLSPGERSLDDCCRSAPPCKSHTPWLEGTPCCPAACFDQYVRARRSDGTPFEAFEEVYFTNASCFPGVRQMRGEE